MICTLLVTLQVKRRNYQHILLRAFKIWLKIYKELLKTKVPVPVKGNCNYSKESCKQYDKTQTT